MDAHGDMQRAVRDDRYKLIRNYLPHNPTRSTSRTCTKRVPCRRGTRPGKTDLREEKTFFEPKPSLEFYDTWATPGVNNLASDPEYADLVTKMSAVLDSWVLDARDSGFLTEAELETQTAGQTVYDFAQDTSRYRLDEILPVANRASERSLKNVSRLVAGIGHKNRYWSVTGWPAWPTGLLLRGPHRNSESPGSPGASQAPESQSPSA